MNGPDTPAAPAGLCDEAVALWDATVANYDFEERHLALLRAACRELTRAAAAEAKIDAEGIVVPTRGGDCKPHPAVAIARNARIAFTRIMRDLQFEDESADPYTSRPPRRTGRT